VNALVARGEQCQFARPFEIGRFVLEAEPTPSDATGQAGVDCTQVPSHLADGPSLGIRAEVILARGESREHFDGTLGFHVPDGAKPVCLVGVCHAHTSRLDAEVLPPNGSGILLLHFTSAGERSALPP
jgi:hypothetical protein